MGALGAPVGELSGAKEPIFEPSAGVVIELLVGRLERGQRDGDLLDGNAEIRQHLLPSLSRRVRHLQPAYCPGPLGGVPPLNRVRKCTTSLRAPVACGRPSAWAASSEIPMFRRTVLADPQGAAFSASQVQRAG